MDFFNSIVSFFEIIYNFIVNLVTSLMSLFNALQMVITIPVTFTGILFPAIVSSMVIVIAVGILYKVLGR